jgi:hypothetical protein
VTEPPLGVGVTTTRYVTVTGGIAGFVDALRDSVVTAAGVTGFDGADAALGPTAFVATTVNASLTPFVKPLTIADACEPGTVTDAPSGEPVTV